MNMMEKMKTGASFRVKVFLLIFALMSLQMIFMGVNFHQSLLDTLEHQVGTRALIQAKEIASDPNLIQEVRDQKHPRDRTHY